MRRVSSAELVRRFSLYTDAALSEPVVLTRNGRDRLVLINIELYRELLALSLLHKSDDARLKRIAKEFRQLSLDLEALAPAAPKKKQKL